MKEGPLVTSRSDRRGTPLWSRFLLAGAALYAGILTIVVVAVHHRTTINAGAVLTALAITAAVLLGVAGLYWLAVKSLAGSRRGVWFLPDAASVHTSDAEPGRALRRVSTLPDSAAPWVRSSSGDRSLTLTRNGMWGKAFVQIDAVPSGGGTELHLRAGSSPRHDEGELLAGLFNNLIARGMIARILAELANGGNGMHA